MHACHDKPQPPQTQRRNGKNGDLFADRGDQGQGN